MTCVRGIEAMHPSDERIFGLGNNLRLSRNGCLHLDEVAERPRDPALRILHQGLPAGDFIGPPGDARVRFGNHVARFGNERHRVVNLDFPGQATDTFCGTPMRTME